MSFDKMSTDEIIKKPFIKPDLIPEPHFIPGYTGFCPDLPRVVGSSFGRVTNEILKENPHVAAVLRPVAPEIGCPEKIYQLEMEQMKRDKKLINSRFPRVGRRVLNDYIMPGYCGHVPNNTDAIGINFTRGCVKSISEFVRQQAKSREIRRP